MAKKTGNGGPKIKEPMAKVKGPKSRNLSEPKSKEISIQKYFQLHVSGLHLYYKAYLGGQFRGIMKTKEAWKEELKQIMEGKK